MLTMMRRLLLAPIFEDEETTRIAALLNLALLSLLAVAVPFSVFTLLLPDEIRRVLWLTTFAVALLSGISLWLLRRGHVQTASRLAIVGFWLILTTELIPLGGLRSPVYSAYFIVILMTGLLLGGRAAIVVSACSILASLGILLLEAYGLLPVVQYTSSAEWIVKAAFFFVIAVLIYLAISVTEKALARSRQTERALTERNQQLEREIAERITAEQKLREQAALLENISDAVVSVDFNYTIRSWNKAAEEIYGWAAEEVLGQQSDFLKTEYISGTRDAVLQQLMHDGFWRGENSQLCKDGTRIWVMASATVLRDAAGNPTAVLAVNRDISERKAAEERLRLSEERYRIISELSSDYAYAFRVESDTEATLEWVTEAYTRVTGYGLDNMTRLSQWDSTIHPDDIPAVREARRRMIAKQPTQPMQFRIITQSGETRWLNNHLKAVWDEAGKRIVRVYGTAQDITERKLAEDKLRESEKIFRALVESAPQSILLVNTKGEIVLANSKVQEMFGYTPDELLGQSIERLVPERYRDIHQTHRAEFAAHPSARPMDGLIGLMARRKDGSIFPAEIGLNYAEMDDGLLVMSFVTDITERKRAEDKVRESEAQLRTILNGMPIGCILNDTESRFTYWNPAAERMFGYRFEEVQGKQAFGLIVPPEFENSVADFNQRVLQGDGTIRTVGENLTSDGQRIICEWTCTPLRNAEGTAAGIIAMCQDITQRKQLEDALQRTLDELEQRVEERTVQLSAAQERLHFLLSSTPVVIYSYTASPDYRATFVSNRVIDLLGYEPADFINDNRFWIARVHPDDAERIALETSKSYQAGRGVLEYRFRCADGNYRWLHDENRVVSDAEGNPLEIIGYWIDITEQKQAEQALVAAEERLRMTIEGAYEAFIAIDEAGIITDWNGQAETVFGWSRREVVGRSLAEIIIPQSQREAHRRGLERFLATGEGALLNNRIEVTALHSDGHEFPVELTITPIRLGDRYLFNAFLHDISERKQSEIALRESEERFRAISEAMPIGIVVSRLKTGEILFLNETHAALFGLTADEYTKRNSAEFWVDFSLRQGIVEDLQRQGYVHNYELPLKKADGTHFWALYSSKVISFGGEPAILTGMYDITRRKQAEIALQESEERFRAMSEAMPIGIVVTRMATGEALFLNDTHAGLFGLTREAYLQHDPSDFWVDFSMRQGIIEKLLQQGYIHNHELRLKKGDGTPFWALYSSKVITFGGEPAVLTGVYDITPRKQAEIALQESEERFRAISEAMPIGVMVTRVDDSTILFMNEAQAQLFGVTLDQYFGLDGREFYADPNERPALVERFKRDGYILNHEIRAKKADGTLFWVIYSCKLISFGGEPAILTGMYDITSRKEAEARIEQLNHELAQHAQELEFANRELEAFTYSVSHDLRAPLRALDGFSRILQEDFSAQLPGEAQRFLGLVRSNAQQMGNLINDLLNLSRLSRQPLRKQQVQLQHLVAEVYESLSPERENRQVEFVLGDLPDCQADPNLLKQVIVNLLSNALKFTRQCEVARIEVGHQVVEREIVYFVKDNGVGFDMQYANKLFGLFQRLHRMEDFEGTGVGLAVIQRIIRRHGGRIWAEAEVNRGATFYFSLGE